MIAHELAHAIDPCYITKGPSDTSFKYPKGKTYEETQEFYPVPSLISCLRGENSVGARASMLEQTNTYGESSDLGWPPSPNVEDYREKSEIKVIKVSSDMGSTENSGDLVPNDQGDPVFSSFCNSDQINETVSDWWAAEVLTEYMADHHKDLKPRQFRNGYSNVFRGDCAGPPMLQNTGGHDHGAYYGSFAVHPPMKSRINNLLLVNPRIRKQMGCQGKHQKFVYCDGSSVPQDSTAPKIDYSGDQPTEAVQ